MQAIFEYLSVGDLWGLAIIGGMMLILGANCSYQKYRAPACDRIAKRLAERNARPARDRQDRPRRRGRPGADTVPGPAPPVIPATATRAPSFPPSTTPCW